MTNSNTGVPSHWCNLVACDHTLCTFHSSSDSNGEERDTDGSSCEADSYGRRETTFEPSTGHGCAKVVKDQVRMDQFSFEREERKLDFDLQHQRLILAMLSSMVFDKILQSVNGVVPEFSPFSCESNRIKHNARAVQGIQRVATAKQ